MSTIRQLSAPELKTIMESGAPLELVDVRTVEERDIARLAGARLLDKTYFDYLRGLDKQTLIVFHCHHGVRSQAAAEFFEREGFENLCNVAGGIDAWSILVDPSVPRY